MYDSEFSLNTDTELLAFRVEFCLGMDVYLLLDKMIDDIYEEWRLVGNFHITVDDLEYLKNGKL